MRFLSKSGLSGPHHRYQKKSLPASPEGRWISRAHLELDLLHEFASLVCLAVNFDLPQTAVGIEGNGGVEEEVAVADQVHRAMTEEAADVLLQLLADAEGVVESFHQVLLFGRQPVWVARVEGGEVGVEQRIVFPFEAISAAAQVDVLQSASAVDVPFGMCID